MTRRIIYGAVIGVVCLGLIVVFLVNRFEKTEPVGVLQAIPEDAVLFAEKIDYNYLTETFLPESRIWVDFVNIVERSELDSMMNMGLRLIRSSEPLNELLLKEGFNLSLHKVGKNQLIPLVYLEYSASHSDHEFEHMILAMLEKQAMVNERKYEAETVYDVSGNPGMVPGKFTFACVNGLCLISSSSMLMEESIRTIHDDTNLTLEPGLKKVRNTAGRYVHANLYLNYERFPDLLYPFIKESFWGKLGTLSSISSWGELDLDVNKASVTLNGMTQANPDLPLFLGAFREQSPVKMELHEKLPSGITSFLHLGIGDRVKFKEHILDYWNGLGKGQEIETEIQRIQKLYGFDPLDDLSRILDDEMAWFTVEGTSNRPGDELLIVETRSRSETVDVVMQWVNQYLRLNALDMQSIRDVYWLDNQTSFNIYRLGDLFFKGTAAAPLFNEYFAVYENYLIFGPSTNAISRVIYQNVLHKTFVSDHVYRETSGYFSNRSNVTLFFRPFAFMDNRKELLVDRISGQLGKLELYLRRIPGVVIQFSAENDIYYQSISAKYTPQLSEKALTVWESLMDTAIMMKPALVVNHNTSEKEIFVQDRANKVYLINGAGRILWKQPIEGPILGEVHQVDFFKNGKLQYLFNTAEKIHLVDRNGNYVERYPVSLRSEATSPLALIDYDRNRDYRIFIACEDRKIYLYDIEGNIVTGWGFGKTESKVTGAIQHFRIGDRDYIVAVDQKRAYFLDRQGKERIRVKERPILSPQNQLVLDMNIRENKPRWVSTDTSGNVIAIYQDGSVSMLLNREMSPDHFFTMVDLNSDGIPEYIFADGDELEVVQQDGKRLFSFRVKNRISDMPDIYKFSNSDIKIGITDRSRNRIYLINSDGSLYDGFPLEGSTRFSIGYFTGSGSRFNLIVGSENNFLYNYSIE